MKKYKKSERYIQHMRRRARRSLNAQLRHKAYLRNKRRALERIPAIVIRERNRSKSRPYAYNRIAAPEKFCFLENPEGMCEFIQKLSWYYDEHLPVFVELADVKKIEFDGIAVLLSVMVQFKSKKIRFNGNRPADPSVAAVVESSQFFKHLYESYTIKDVYELAGTSAILTHGGRKVDGELAQKVVEAAVSTVWDGPFGAKGLYRTLVELMQNTTEHASLEKEGEKHWWLSINHVKAEKRVVFSFVDFGVGIFQSLARRKKVEWYVRGTEQLVDLIGLRDNPKVLRMMLRGEIHRTASGDGFRGKGLPSIYSSFQQNKISNLAIITNNVYFNATKNEFRKLRSGFAGTFVTWELNETNKSNKLKHEPVDRN